MFTEIWLFQITVSALACAAIFSHRGRNPSGGALLGVPLGFIESWRQHSCSGVGR
jgi:hypothetical protein